MDLKAVLVGSMASGLAGCGLRCGPNSDFTDVSQSFTRDEMDWIFRLAEGDELRDRCDWACIEAVWAQFDNQDPTEIHACELVVDEDYVQSDPDVATDTANPDIVGSVVCSGVKGPVCMGRRPMGHPDVDHQTAAPGFRRLATLEHVSVAAFHELALQLARFDAPPALRARCLRAARDEVRHTATFCGLGGIDPATLPAQAPALGDATPFEVAAHNAVEGCVNECWAALLAGWQSLHAAGSEVRAVFHRLAADEASHGQLAWDIHRWFLETLPAEQSEDLVRLQRDALESLLRAAADPSAGWPAQLGFPNGSVATRLVTTFASGLTESVAA